MASCTGELLSTETALTLWTVIISLANALIIYNY